MSFFWLYNSGKAKNQTINENNPTEIRFFGPAKNCKELGLLGYTLNGYYLVNGRDQSNTSGIEVIFCPFKQPKGFKESKNKEFSPFEVQLFYMKNWFNDTNWKKT